MHWQVCLRHTYHNAWRMPLKAVAHGATRCKQMTLYHAPHLGNGEPRTPPLTACDMIATLLEEIASRH